MVENKTKSSNWLKVRWLLALIGIYLIVVGQWKINIQIPPDAPPLPLGTWLTEQIHLADPNIDQVLYGLPLLVAGGLLLALSLRGIPLMPALKDGFKENPLALSVLRSRWRWLLVGFGFFVILLLRLGSLQFSLSEISLLLISLTLIGLAFLLWDRDRKVDLSPHIARPDLLWMIGLLAVGVVIGAFRLQGLPAQLVGDEGAFWTIARDIAINKFQPSIFAPGVYSFPIFSSYIQGWLLKVFGISLWGWRFSSVLSGLAAVWPLYLLAREMFNRRLAVISSIMLITSPYFIDFSRLGYNNIQALFFTALTLYWLYIGLNRKSSLYLYLAGCMAGLGFYTYFAARIALVISLLFILLIWMGKKIKFSAFLHAACLIGLGFTLVVTPYFIYGQKVDPQGLSYKSFESAFFNSFNGLQFYSSSQLFSVAPPLEINGNELFYNPGIYTVLITRGFIRTMLAFQTSGLISEHYIAFPLAGTIGAVFFLIGLVLAFSKPKQPRNLLLILWFLLNVFGLSVFNTVPPRQAHMVAIIPAIAILIGIGINALADAASVIHIKTKGYGTVILFALITLTAIGGLYDYFVRMPDQYHPQPGEVISWANLESHGESLVYIYSDPSQKDFTPYSEVFNTTSSYQAVTAQDVITGAKIFSSKPTLAFYPPDQAADIQAVLQKQWGDALKTTQFYSTGGELVLIAGMNTPFIFEKDKGLSTVIKDSYLIFSLDLFLIFILVCFILVVILPKTLTLNVPTPLRPMVEWFNAPVAPLPLKAEEQSDWVEEIFLESAKQEMQPDSPPEWAAENYASVPDGHPGPVHVKVNSHQTIDGTDYYLHIHVPRLILPRLQLPWATRVYGTNPASSLPFLNIPDPALLVGGVVSAVAAQILISSQLTVYGVLAYIACGIILIFWARSNPKWVDVFSHQLNLSSSVEKVIAGLILLLVVLTRFFDLNNRVYGLEADETKWTVQSWYSTILRVDLGEFATMHYKYLPVDFWVRSLFLRIFGLNFISARIESVVLSLVSVLFIYLLVRLLTSSPSIALLSALLFGMSFIELNASHQALHNTPPQPWALGSLFFLFLAIKDRKIWQFQITGLLLGLGMLTYETFYPTAVVALVFLFGMAVFEIRNKRDSAENWITRLLLVTWPVVLVYLAFSRDYLAGRQGYLFGWLDYFSGNGHELLGALGFMLGNIRDVLETTFSQVVFTDSLINWNGSLINPLILPFVVIGLVYNIWNIRRPGYLFILLWYLFNTLLGSVFLGSVWPRVMYMTIPSLMIWGALGLWTTFGALRGLLKGRSLKFAVPVTFALMILVIVLNDYHIFTSQLVDPVERQKRRELADLTFSSAGSTPMILYPFMPNQNDTLEVESHILIYSVAGARHLGLDAANYYKQLTEASLLPALWQLKGSDGLDIFYDKTANSFQDQHLKYLQNVLDCYPGTVLKSSARFFDIYHLEPQVLTYPRCYSPAIPTAVAPKDAVGSGDEQPVTFTWDSNGVKTSSFALTLERKLDDIFWIEAEDFQGPGWHSESGFVNDFSGSGFLLDDEYAGQADYNLNVPSPGHYKLWVRFFKRRANDQHNFIDIAGQKLEFADNNSELNQWVWQDMGSFDLNTGQVPLALTRTYGTDEQYSVFIDSIVLTSELNYQPDGENGEWQLIKSTGELNSTLSQYQLDVNLLPGEYRWKVRVFDGDKIVDSSGERGVEGNVTNFVIR